MEHIGVLRQHRIGLRHPALRRCQLRRGLLALRTGLEQTRLVRVQGGGRGIIGRLLGIEILLGQELVLVQLLGAVEVQFGVLQIRLRMVDDGLLRAQAIVGCFQPGFGRIGIRLRRHHLRFLGSNLRLGLDILHPRHQLSLAHAVAFLHQNLGEQADGVGAYVDVILGLNLARGGYQASQVLAHHLSGLDGHHAALAEHRAGINANAQRKHNQDNNDGFPFGLHECGLLLC